MVHVVANTSRTHPVALKTLNCCAIARILQEERKAAIDTISTFLTVKGTMTQAEYGTSKIPIMESIGHVFSAFLSVAVVCFF